MADTESDDADNLLLVDWKGDGGPSLVQQKLPFRQVKRRELPISSKTLPSKVEAPKRAFAPQRLRVDVSDSDLNGGKSPILLLSLSDSEPSKLNSRGKGSTVKASQQPPVAGNVVCLDSDSESDKSVSQWNFKPCRTVQLSKSVTLERIIEKSEVRPQIPAEFFYGGSSESLGTPVRATSDDRNCTLDTFGSGSGYSPLIDGPTISSTSKRADSNRRKRQESEGQPGSKFQFLDHVPDRNLGFDSLTPEVRGSNKDVNGEGLNTNTTLNIPSARSLSELHEVELPLQTDVGDEGEGQVGAVRKKRKVAGGKPLTEEEKALAWSEKLRAKEAEKLRKSEERAEKKRQKEEEKKRLQEENRRKREEEKLRKEEAKEEAKERRRVEHEKNKWEKGKFALQNTRALIDTKVVEKGAIGGHLLGRLAEKQLQYQLVCNSMPRSVVWRMKRPSADCPADAVSQFFESEEADGEDEPMSSQLVLEEVDVPYVLFVLEAEEFATMVGEKKLDEHIFTTQQRYPGFTICYLINKLKWFLNKKDQTQYKAGECGWKRPPIEQAMARLVTHYNGVHSRLCLDEAEVAEHITGLMRSLAECPFRPKLTSLSVSKNGDHVSKGETFREEIKKSLWLKALVALPRVPGSCALAIAKEYRNMRGLLNAYLDRTKPVLAKELLLQDLIREGLLGLERSRRVGPACSRRVYRIIMAQNGNLKTDDVEQGADHFDDD